MHIDIHANYPPLLSVFNVTQIFSTGFRNIPKYKKGNKIPPVEPRCSLGTDGRAHMTKLDVHESVHRDTIMKITKMQLYRLIYYS
jgi:hypothetical protein